MRSERLQEREVHLFSQKSSRVSKQLGPVMWNIINACGVNEPKRRQIIEILSEDQHAMTQALLTVIGGFEKSPKVIFFSRKKTFAMTTGPA